jgi:hypothetical protein
MMNLMTLADNHVFLHNPAPPELENRPGTVQIGQQINGIPTG